MKKLLPAFLFCASLALPVDGSDVIFNIRWEYATLAFSPSEVETPWTWDARGEVMKFKTVYEITKVMSGGARAETDREYMNAIGAQGWELVAVVSVRDGFTQYYKKPRPRG